MKTSTPLGVLDMVPLLDFFQCKYSAHEETIVDYAADINSTVGSGSDLMERCCY